MANDLTSNPWIIDTAGAGAVSTDRLKLKALRWVGATTAGHQVIVKDQTDVVKWESIASGANNVEESAPFSEDFRTNGMNGLKVPTLGSGKLYVYF